MFHIRATQGMREKLTSCSDPQDLHSQAVQLPVEHLQVEQALSKQSIVSEIFSGDLWTQQDERRKWNVKVELLWP